MKITYCSVFSIAMMILYVITIVIYLFKIIPLKEFLSLLVGLSIISLIALYSELVSKKNKAIPMPIDDTINKLE